MNPVIATGGGVRKLSDLFKNDLYKCALFCSDFHIDLGTTRYMVSNRSAVPVGRSQSKSIKPDIPNRTLPSL